MMSVETEISFNLNGRDVRLKVPADMKTLAMLRDKLVRAIGDQRP